MSLWRPENALCIEPYGPEILNTLAKRNPHPRDEKLAFTDDDHKYYLSAKTRKATEDLSKNLISCTRFVHQYEREFNAEEKSADMATKPATARNPKYADLLAGLPQAQWAAALKNQWATSGLESRTTGTEMHECLEDYVNGQPLRHDPPPPEYHLGVMFLEEAQRDWGLVPFRSEWMIYADNFADESDGGHRLGTHNFGITGSVDLVMCFVQEVEAGHVKNLVVVDWKRTKELKLVEVFRGESLRDELSSMPNSNGSTYSLQTAAYKWILETFYGFQVKAHVLVCCVPDAKLPLVYHAEDHPQLLGMMCHRRMLEFGAAEALG